MDQKFVDAITNVRLVSGTIRIDLMNITGQTEDNKLQFSKTGELILSQQAFGQALSTMQEVDAEIKKFVDMGYERAKKVLKEKIEDLHKLAKALLVYETLTGSEIEDLINKNVYPPNKEDLKVEEDNSGSALESIGLKPKIVH